MIVDIGQPWSIAPRKGKHYGTIILDRDGSEVMRFWDGSGEGEGSEPSIREWIKAEELSDGHYECRRDYERALALVELVNAAI